MRGVTWFIIKLHWPNPTGILAEASSNLSLNLSPRKTSNLIHYRIFIPLCISAPPYCGPHNVTPQGWNYPQTREEIQDYSVDLGGHPPYHQPPEGFKVPNGHLALVSSDSGSDGDASMTSATAVEAGNMNIIDTNRNIT